MAYIGRGLDKLSNVDVLNAITFTDSAGPYNITKGSPAVAFIPSAIQNLLIEVDGVIQASASYTITGSTITFGVSMSSSSTMNSFIHFGMGVTMTPADGTVSTVKIVDDAVTTAKILDANVTNAKTSFTPGLTIKGDGSSADGKLTLNCSQNTHGVHLQSPTHASAQSYTLTLPATPPATDKFIQTNSSGQLAFASVTEYDDNQVQSNIAMLGFKVATNGSLVKYNLVDQTIDEYFDTSGVDSGASTNATRTASGSNYYYQGKVAATVTQNADSSAEDGADTVLKWTTVTASGSFVTDTTMNVEYLIVAGGGSGCRGNSGGAGAGGYLANGSKTLSLTGGNTYTIVVGAGGTGLAGDSGGETGSNSSMTGTGITTLTCDGGGKAGGGGATAGADGGSGGAPGYLSTTAGEATGNGLGYDSGAAATGGPRHGASGGGGASEVGQNGTTTDGGDGGDGLANDITGASVYYAGGGGGSTDNTTANSGAGGNGGGGPGASTDNSVDAYSDATANTGGGGGSAYYSGTGHTRGGHGGSGIAVLRYQTTTSVDNMTLQSTDATAGSAPTYGEFVTLIENAEGTATLNTDIKGYVSRDSGTTFTQGTLVDEGTWGTNKKVLGFHDLDISAQPSGVAMCYKITTHNQVASSKETRVYAASIGWR